MPTVLLVIGTRPEAIKLAPVILALRARGDEIATAVCVTSQHGRLVDEVLEAFAITPDHRLPDSSPDLTLIHRAAALIDAMADLLDRIRPDVVVVQGDTTSVLASAIAAFHARIPVAHVEAGLRSHDLHHPFPEEANRRMVSCVTGLHLAPTDQARSRLIAEGIPARAIAVTGNPGLDALRIALDGGLGTSQLDVACRPEERLVLVTAHRRESFGAGLRTISDAIAAIAAAFPDSVRIVFPVHPNPQVDRPVRARLGGLANVTLLGPVPYVDMVALLNRSHLVLTDSGGLQEEGPALGKPVLVMRETTERPEAVEAGATLLVGRKADRIVERALWLLNDADSYARMAVPRPIFGDGHAGERIADLLIARVGRAGLRRGAR